METEKFLREVTALPGLTGNERKVSEYIASAFAPYCDDVAIDGLNSVIAYKKGTGAGPRVTICAHLDEIGMMVSKIEDDGSLRLERVGGVDPRILPGQRVRVYGKEMLWGVVGATSPHLLSAEDRKKNYTFDNIFVDLGMSADKVKELVHQGDLVAYEAKFTELLNRRFATKTADDRACVGIMLRAAELLTKMTHTADLTFVATCQEEIGSYGALTAGFSTEPDFGVALDVCHAATPGAPKLHTHDLDSLSAAVGPYINPYLRKRLDEVAKAQNIKVQIGVTPRYTSTDADELSIVRDGVPTVLLELPLKYMHTTVETFDMHALEEGGRLLANYLAAIDASWEGELWN